MLSFLLYNLEKKCLLQKHVYFYSNAVLTKTLLYSTWYNLQNFYREREERVNVDFYTPSITWNLALSLAISTLKQHGSSIRGRAHERERKRALPTSKDPANRVLLYLSTKRVRPFTRRAEVTFKSPRRPVLTRHTLFLRHNLRPIR